MQPFPGPGGKRVMSTEGGTDPVWSRDGRELFYLNDNKMMVVDVASGPTLSDLKPGLPRFLFEGRYFVGGIPSSYDVSLDGQRFLRIQPVEPEQPATQIDVVMNWFEELKARVPR